MYTDLLVGAADFPRDLSVCLTLGEPPQELLFAGGLVSYCQLSVPAFMMSPEWSVNKAGALDWGRHMRNIVDEAGEIIAKATDDHTLIGGHHRLAVAASLGQKLFWKHTGEPVKLDPFFKGSSHRDTA